MADNSSVSDTTEKKKRVRGPKFSPSEIDCMIKEYSKVKASLISSKVPNSVKNKLWEGIAFRVSAVGVCCRTVKEVKTKWFNMTRESKLKNAQFNRETTKTGGGPPVPEPEGFISDIIDIMKDDQGFSGIPGSLETSLDGK